MIVLRNTSFKRFANRKNVNLVIKKYESTSAAAKLHEPNDEETRKLQKLQPLKKLPQKLPFVKNFMLAHYDTDLLAYPEFLGERRLRLLDANTEFLRNVVSETVDSKEIDTICNIPENVKQMLRNLKLFGITASTQYGGLELTHTERARLFEVLSEDTSLAAMLFCHETLGYKVIERFGNDEQKEKFLKKFASGKWTAAFCANEPESGADMLNASTYALKTGTEFLISGAKSWVMNADQADFFLVFAKPKSPNQLRQPKNKYYEDEGHVEDFVCDDLAVFIVDKNSPGITIGERKDTLGVRGLHMCDVHFSDTPVSKSHMLGDIKQGYDIARQFLVEDRYLIGVFALSILRKMQKDMAEYSIKRKLYGDNLCNYGLTQVKLSRNTVNTYVLESMIYFTCGLLDRYENQDCEVENAIVKVFASELAWQSTSESIQLFGGQGYLKNYPYERYLRDMKILSLFDVSNEVLRMFIALCCLKYVSNDINEEVVQVRNPYFHPKQVMKKFFGKLRVDFEHPKLYLKLYEYVHPTLGPMSELLETCLLRFEHGVSTALYRDACFLVEDQWALNRIAEGVMLLYAMTAVISRASRSYCIGSRNAFQELQIAEAYIKDCHHKFKDIVEGLIEGDIYVTDALHKQVALRTIESRGYFLEEPLKLNY